MLKVLARVLGWSMALAMAVMLAAIAWQVLLRYFFNRTPTWTEELAILMFAWATLGGLALGVREGFHVRLTVLLAPLPPGARVHAERVIDGFAAVLGAFLAWAGWRFVDITSGGRSAAIGYPIEFLHALAPVAGVLMCLFALERVIRGPVVAPPAADTPDP